MNFFNFFYFFQNTIFVKKIEAIIMQRLVQLPGKFLCAIWNLVKKTSKIRKVRFTFENLQKISNKFFIRMVFGKLINSFKIKKTVHLMIRGNFFFFYCSLIKFRNYYYEKYEAFQPKSTWLQSRLFLIFFPLSML